MSILIAFVKHRAAVSEQLRDRCAHAYYRLRWARDDWATMQPVHRESYYEVADVVLTEIESAGYVVVERERFLDLEAAELALENCRELYQRDLGTWVRPDKFERVRRLAEAANAVQQHKNDVLGRDTISLPEVERLNLRLHPLYAEMEEAWLALQSGDLGGEADE